MKNQVRAFLAVAFLAALLIGCASPEARIIRTEFAIESEVANRDNAVKQREIALHHIEQNMQNEVARLQAVLVRQNELAAGDAQRVAQNYIDYHNAMEELRKRVLDEHQKVESLHAEQLALGKNFRAISGMADKEIDSARQSAALTINDALKAAEAAWEAYQKANPPALPEPEPEPEPPTIEIEGAE